MSDLENAAQPLLIPMLEGRGRTLHEKGQRTLASWALKTAMMFEFTHPETLAVPAEHHRHLYQHGEPPPGVIVALAPYEGRYAAWYRQHPLRVGAKSVRPTDPESHNGYVATLVVDHLVIQVFGSTYAETLGIDRADWIARVVREIWPYSSSLTFAPQPALSDRELDHFASSIITNELC